MVVTNQIFGGVVQAAFPSGLAERAAGRDTLPTNEAATALNRSSQTLRKWACLENGPLRPVRINGRLAWRVSDIAALLTWGASK